MDAYDSFNREERYICSHLFRLLHEYVYPENDRSLKAFINCTKLLKKYNGVRPKLCLTGLYMLRR
jgi:hypothetical protein